MKFVFKVVLIALVLNACSSGKKAYEHGDYYSAVTIAINHLRKKPDHEKSVETLKSAYPLAVQYFELQANNDIASNGVFKWKNVIQSYNQINYLYEQIQQCPACLKIIPAPKNYYSEMGPLKEKAAEESYNAGIAALMNGTRDDAKKAYFNFEDVQSYVSGYKDVIEYTYKAKDVATLKVVVEQIPVLGRYSVSATYFQDKVQEFLRSNYPQKSFINFYTPQEATAANLQNADQILRVQFDDFTVGNTSLKEKEETFTRDSVVISRTKVNGKDTPVYGTVKARLNSYRKEVISAGLLSMTVVDAKSNSVITNRKFQGNYVWGNVWARYNGDERALTADQLSTCKQKELMPPPTQDLFLQFSKQIYDQLVPSVKDFYRQY